MRIKTLLKTLFFLGLGTVVSARASSSTLPAECDHLDLVRGDPLTAKSFIFGEIHNSEACVLTILSCADALTRHVPRENKVALLEGIPSNLETTCHDSRAKYSTWFDDCRGWDVSKKKLNKVTKQMGYWEFFVALRKSIAEFQNILTAATFVPLLQEIYSHYEEEIKNLQKTYKKAFKTHLKKNPNAEQNKFYMLELTRQNVIKGGLSELSDMIENARAGHSYQEVLANFDRKIEALGKESSASMRNPHLLGTQRNNHFFKVLKKVSIKENKVSVSFLGNNHVKEAKKYQSLEEKSNRETMLSTLYQQLDQYADENPYAILSCDGQYFKNK